MRDLFLKRTFLMIKKKKFIHMGTLCLISLSSPLSLQAEGKNKESSTQNEDSLPQNAETDSQVEVLNEQQQEKTAEQNGDTQATPNPTQCKPQGS